MILNWRKTYQNKLVDATTALKNIRRGSRIFIGSACGEPQLLAKRLMDIAPNLADTQIIHCMKLHALTEGELPLN